MVWVLPHFYRPTVEHSPAMLPVGAANLPQESLVTAAGSQSIHIPDSVGRHVNHQMS